MFLPLEDICILKNSSNMGEIVMPIFNEIVIYNDQRAIVSGFSGWKMVLIEYEEDKKRQWVKSNKLKKTGEFVETPIVSFEIGYV